MVFIVFTKSHAMDVEISDVYNNWHVTMHCKQAGKILVLPFNSYLTNCWLLVISKLGIHQRNISPKKQSS